jgi:glyoxylase-like metal-dependent hydrolase (beta-lactamase superfamily II)
LSQWQIGTVTVTRIPEPGFELALPQDDATVALLRAHESWLAPHFVTEDTRLRIGSSATVIRSGATTIVIDPWLAFDGPDRFAPDAQARAERLAHTCARAGVVADDVDVVVNTHIDGAGGNTLPLAGREVPTFRYARYLLPTAEMQRAPDHTPGFDAFESLLEDGRLELVEPDHVLTDEVRIVAAPGHSAGHAAVVVESSGSRAVIVGHLFLHPAQIASPGPRSDLDEDPGLAATTRTEVLDRAARDGTVLVGPLFTSPGGGRVTTDGGSWRLEPVGA